MFKSEGEMAIAISESRVFKVGGWLCKFDPLLKECCDSPFICKHPDTGQWFAMKMVWSEYAIAKEVFTDLEAMRSCVVNYLIGKADISDEAVDDILGMGSDGFWIKGSNGEQTRGFNPRAVFDPRTEVSIYADVDEFAIEKYGDSYLAGK